MTIDDAIRIMKDAIAGVEVTDDPELVPAMKLGIEALQEVKLSRICPPHGICALLPGETEE